MQVSRIEKTTLRKNKSWRTHTIQTKCYYEATVTKQYGTGIQTDMSINETDLKVQK